MSDFYESIHGGPVLDYVRSVDDTRRVLGELHVIPAGTGTRPFTLLHDVFFETGFEIRSGFRNGSLLSRGTDYELVNEVTGNFPNNRGPIESGTENLESPGSETTVRVYSGVTITNATHSAAGSKLYFSYNPLGDSIRSSRFSAWVRPKILTKTLEGSTGSDSIGVPADLNQGNFTFNNMNELNTYGKGFVCGFQWKNGNQRAGNADNSRYRFRFGPSSSDPNALINQTTINDIPLSEWVGEGTGELFLIKINNDRNENRGRWETLNGANVVWDVGHGRYGSINSNSRIKWTKKANGNVFLSQSPLLPLASDTGRGIGYGTASGAPGLYGAGAQQGVLGAVYAYFPSGIAQEIQNFNYNFYFNPEGASNPINNIELPNIVGYISNDGASGSGRSRKFKYQIIITIVERSPSLRTTGTPFVYKGLSAANQDRMIANFDNQRIRLAWEADGYWTTSNLLGSPPQL